MWFVITKPLVSFMTSKAGKYVGLALVVLLMLFAMIQYYGNSIEEKAIEETKKEVVIEIQENQIEKVDKINEAISNSVSDSITDRLQYLRDRGR